MALFPPASGAMALSAALLFALARGLSPNTQGFWIAGSWVAALLVGLASGDAEVPLWQGNGTALLGASLIAWIIGRSSPNLRYLLVVTAVGSVTDLFSFTFGATDRILEAAGDGSPWLRYLSISIPWNGAAQPIVGVGDLAFLGAFFYHSPRFGRAFFWLLNLLPFCALEAVLLIALMFGIAMPAIPFLALALGVAVWVSERPRVRLSETVAPP